jgi:preprotein translocase subunit SecE
VARDRQRAKQRKARRAGQNPGPAPTEPHRTNVPGALEHASGDADEFDAALVAGAGGQPADADADADADVDPDVRADDDLTPAARRDDDEVAALDADADVDYDVEYDDEDDELAEDEEDDAAPVAAGAPARRRSSGAATTERAGAPARGPGRFVAFLRASWAELQRVQWPDRRQVFQATAVVLGFVVVAGLYLGVADRVAQEVVDFII